MTAIVTSASSRPPAPALGDALLAAAGRGVVKGAERVAQDVISEVGRAVKRDLLAAAGARSAKAAATSTKKTTGSGTKKATTSKTTKGYASPKPRGEFAFLDDPKMPIDEKIFRFMSLMAKRSREDLVAKMKEFKSEKPSSSKSGGKTGGLWSALKTALPGLDAVEKLVGNDAFMKLAKELGGPALAAGVTALGLPELAPLALKLGPELVAAAPGLIKTLDQIGAASGAAAGTSGAIGAQSDGKKTLSQEEAMELQFMMEQQQQLFTALSNVMKSMHDTKMAMVGNIR